METIIVKKSGSSSEERLITNPPYTIYGSPVIPESLSFIMKVGGLRKMLDEFELEGEDSLRIEIFSGYRATEYSFIKHKK